MRIVHFCKGCNNGGFIAAWRIHLGLLAQGVDSVVVVRDRNGHPDDPRLFAVSDSRIWWFWFRLRGFLSRLLHSVLLGTGSIATFHLQWIPSLIPRIVLRKFTCDILHVHTPDDGLWALYELGKWPGPILWTFHGMRDFTQGYIIMGEHLEVWMRDGKRSSVHDVDPRFFAGANLALKKKQFRNRVDTCVSPSKYISQSAIVSGVFSRSRHVVIPNCVPVDVFTPLARDQFRKMLTLSNQFVIAVGAHSLSDVNKGFDLFLESLEQIFVHFRCDKSRFCLLLFGSCGDDVILPDGLQCIKMGKVPSQDLVKVYAAADVLVVPSREENFPNVIIEALSCGTPYVGFKTGGVSDMVDLVPLCGKIVDTYDTRAMAQALIDLQSESDELRQIRRCACRQSVMEHCCPSNVSKNYIDEYHKLLANR